MTYLVRKMTYLVRKVILLVRIIANLVRNIRFSDVKRGVEVRKFLLAEKDF